jgi:hypothetical protein
MTTKKTPFIICITILYFALFSFHTYAQIPIWAWAESGAGSSDDYVNSVAADSGGNVYVTGKFLSPTITFGSFVLTNVNAPYYYDLFLVKYDNNGNVIWARSAGGSDDEEAFSVTVDANGNVYLSGYSRSSTVTFDTLTLINSGYWNAFLVKYDNNGNALWVKSAPESGLNWRISVTTDVNGNIFIAGSYDAPTITFGTFTLTNAGNVDMFLVKYNNNGNVLWAKSMGGISNDWAQTLACDDSGNILVSGYFRSSVINFDSFILNNAGVEDIFLVKYDNNGNVLWAKSAGGIKSDRVESVIADSAGNIIVGGYFYSPAITFGTATLTNAGNCKVFLAKYDNNGNVLWAKSEGGDFNGETGSLASDNSGNIFMVGYFGNNTIIFDAYTLVNNGVFDIFLVKFDNQGNVVWAKNEGGSYYDVAESVTTDINGNIYLAGNFASSAITFGSFILTNVHSNSYDVCIAMISSIDGIKKGEYQEAVSVYPNPTSGNITVKSNINKSSIEIYNMLGEKMYNSKINSEIKDIDFSNKPKGIYFIKIYAGEKIQIEKIVMQ